MQAQGTERIAFLGGGHMARALIGGLLRERIAPAQIRVGEPRAEAREALAGELGVEVSPDNRHALAGATLVVLAVKPQDATCALQALYASGSAAPSAGAGAAAQPPVLLSIAAGLTIAQLARASPPGTPIVRAMPNRPALLGAGITGLYVPPQTPPRARALAELIGRAAGRAVWLRTEDELDVVTALSGSGPAYFFLLAERLARAAQALGLPADTAELLAAETLYGAGVLAHQVAAAGPGAASLAQERRAVTSRGGTTAAALQVLEEGGFDALIARALQAAAARAAQLAAGTGMPAAAAPEDAGHGSAPSGTREATPASVYGPGHRL
ncbi:MAG TPA: pyrroline-5-carboxylate reductase [Steroidobacteraceae bacterium]|nr:pyrroline-5-carboxylate reductase [Steroidobacteraceae bacterium]